MVETFEVNGRTYTVKTVQPWVQPYLTAYGALARKQPETVEDAERFSEEVKKVLQKILSLVDPYPPDEDMWPVFFALMSVIQRRGDEASKFFRPRVAKGGRNAGGGDSSASKRSAGDGSG